MSARKSAKKSAKKRAAKKPKMNPHPLAQIELPGGAVAVCQCGWRSPLVGNEDEAHKAHRLHQAHEGATPNA